MAIERDGGVLRSLRTVFEAGSVAGLSDRQLLERVADRDDPGAEPAFAALVERHGPMVLRVCRARLADPHDADDAFQAVFCLLARKAGTLWVRDSLGPWLLGVALRIAASTRAEAIRRRAFERRYAEASPRIAAEDRIDDLAPLLIEEVGRLPERFRSAVVLCDLEGLSHGEAARRLGWPVGTVKSRQARGRDRLRRRLILRGLAPAAVGSLAPLLSPRSSPAAVPRPLAERAVRAAIRSAAGATSTSGAALLSGVLTMMTTHRIASIIAALLLIGAAAVGRPGGPAAGPRLRVAGPDEAGFPPSAVARDDGDEGDRAPKTIPSTVSGRATDAGKNPVVGATVFLLDARFEVDTRSEGRRVLAQTRTDGDGSYLFEGVDLPLTEPAPGPIRRKGARTPSIAAVEVVATCPGFGISWHDRFAFTVADDPRPGAPVGERLWMDLQCRPDDAIRGTIVGEDNRPMAGVVLELDWIDRLPSDPREDTRLRLDFLRDALPEWAGLGVASTGADGRFRIDGLPSASLGSLRLRHPSFDGSGFIFRSVTAGAPEVDPERRGDRLAVGEALRPGSTLMLPEFRPVPVRVVDDATGAPIEGARVGLTSPPDTEFFAAGTSDAGGSLTLGLPPGTYPGLSAEPPEGASYLRGGLQPLAVGPRPADSPIELRLRPGFELIIDTVDAETGAPLPGAVYWLAPDDGRGGPSSPLTSSQALRPGGQIRRILPPEPGRSYRVRLAGFPGVMAIPSSREGRDKPSPFPVEPRESMPFEPVAGEGVRLRFEVRSFPIGG